MFACCILLLLIRFRVLVVVVTMVFIDEVEGDNRRIIDGAGGRVYNPTIRP